MTFSSASLDAGLVGLLCSVPLVVCSVVGHARETKDEFPVLDELYASQREVLTPWLSGGYTTCCFTMVFVCKRHGSEGWSPIRFCIAFVSPHPGTGATRRLQQIVLGIAVYGM
jgi:hypothetical protein